MNINNNRESRENLLHPSGLGNETDYLDNETGSGGGQEIGPVPKKLEAKTGHIESSWEFVQGWEKNLYKPGSEIWVHYKFNLDGEEQGYYFRFTKQYSDPEKLVRDIIRKGNHIEALARTQAASGGGFEALDKFFDPKHIRTFVTSPTGRVWSYFDGKDADALKFAGSKDKRWLFAIPNFVNKKIGAGICKIPGCAILGKTLIHHAENRVMSTKPQRGEDERVQAVLAKMRGTTIASPQISYFSGRNLGIQTDDIPVIRSVPLVGSIFNFIHQRQASKHQKHARQVIEKFNKEKGPQLKQEKLKNINEQIIAHLSNRETDYITPEEAQELDIENNPLAKAAYYLEQARRLQNPEQKLRAVIDSFGNRYPLEQYQKYTDIDQELIELRVLAARIQHHEEMIKNTKTHLKKDEVKKEKEAANELIQKFRADMIRLGQEINDLNMEKVNEEIQEQENVLEATICEALKEAWKSKGIDVPDNVNLEYLMAFLDDDQKNKLAGYFQAFHIG